MAREDASVPRSHDSADASPNSTAKEIPVPQPPLLNLNLNLNMNSGFNLSNWWHQITLIEADSSDDRNNNNSNNGINAAESDSAQSQPIVVLGHSYQTTEEAHEDIIKKLCLTYRYGFERIPRAVNGPSPLSFMQSVIFSKSLLYNLQNFNNFIEKENFTTDVGWGCMIRTSQSLLANTFVRLLDKQSDIIALFNDTYLAPFSLHNFIRVASSLPLKVKPGEWFGPNAASLSIKRLCDGYYDNSTSETILPRINVLISESTDLYDSQIAQLLEPSTETKGLLVLLPVRLGIDSINSYYFSSLLHLLSLEQSVGIAGGKPSSSFYFFGYQDNSLIYMDPHSAQIFSSDIDMSTYYATRYQRVDIGKLDPSMLIGVFIRDLTLYENFKKSCLDAANKIVHFHATERLTVPESRRKNSEFVNINRSDLKDEDYINIDRVNRLDSTDDFIDLGDDYVETNTNLEEATPLAEDTVPVSTLSASELEITTSSYETPTSKDDNSSRASLDVVVLDTTGEQQE